jgi:aspartyl-tRNA(Asn)/glutamyl-tRNA(Gln) amidotransferase subunit C
MPLSYEEVKHLAYLARISIDDEYLSVYANQMDKILEYFNMLDELNVDAEPYRSLKDMDSLREDEVREVYKDILTIAKNRKDRFIKAPRIM